MGVGAVDLRRIGPFQNPRAGSSRRRPVHHGADRFITVQAGGNSPTQGKQSMKLNQLTPLRLLFSMLVLCCYTTAIVGCSGSTSPDQAADTDHDDHDHDDHDGHDHDDDDHDHDDHDGHDHGDEDDSHAGHDHAPHGPNGGHMVELSGGSHAEWVHDDQKDEILVYVENPESVEKVEMNVTIEGETTPYALERIEGKDYFGIVSPDLLFAVKMGDSVETELIVTTADGEASGAVKHHAH